MTAQAPDPGAGLTAVGTALAAIAIGAATGGAVISLILLAAYGMERGPMTPFADIALGGGALALAVAAGTTFAIARRLGPWRAALAAMVAVAGAAFLTVLTTPADLAFGRAGVAGLSAVCVAVIVAAARPILRR